MGTVGIVMVVVGILLMLSQIFMGFGRYHLTHPHDMHQFIAWMAVGLVIAIVGGLLARRNEE